MRGLAAAALIITSLMWWSCEREDRRYREAPPYNTAANGVETSELHPAGATPPPNVQNPYEENAYAVSQGKTLFDAYNCSGCHAHGGGGIGPPLLDAKWIYGSAPANIYQTIVEGRPNGMPAFRGKIPDYQVWELVAYVRSLSGQLRKDVAPQRDDHMSGKKSEQQTPRETPSDVQSAAQPKEPKR